MYKTFLYIGAALIGFHLAFRLATRIANEVAIRKRIRAEFEHVLNSDQHKVKGKFE